MKIHNLNISSLKWIYMQKQLKRRGKLKNESGAFLVGKTNSNKIVDILFYDDLDPNSIKSGYIKFSGNGYVKLWQHLNSKRMTVFADVHTHPGSWVRQSDTDKTHPMIEQIGHISIIIPNFSKNVLLSLKKVGVYIYKGNFEWKKI